MNGLEEVVRAMRMSNPFAAVQAVGNVAAKFAGASFPDALLNRMKESLHIGPDSTIEIDTYRVEELMARLLSAGYSSEGLLSLIATQRTQQANLKIQIEAETLEYWLSDEMPTNVPSDGNLPPYRGAYLAELILRKAAYDNASRVMNTNIATAQGVAISMSSVLSGADRQFGGASDGVIGQYARVLAEIADNHPMNEGRRNAAQGLAIRDMKLAENALAWARETATTAVGSFQSEESAAHGNALGLEQNAIAIRARHGLHASAKATLELLRGQLEIEGALAGTICRYAAESAQAETLARAFVTGFQTVYGSLLPKLATDWIAHAASLDYSRPEDIENLLSLLSRTDMAMREVVNASSAESSPVELNLTRQANGEYMGQLSKIQIGMPDDGLLRGIGLAIMTLGGHTLSGRITAKWGSEDRSFNVPLIGEILSPTRLMVHGTSALWNRKVPDTLGIRAERFGDPAGPQSIKVLLTSHYVKLPRAQ